MQDTTNAAEQVNIANRAKAIREVIRVQNGASQVLRKAVRGGWVSNFLENSVSFT